MPIIVEEVPYACRSIVASNIMTREVVTLKPVETIERVAEVLFNTKHHSFPIMNSKGMIIGTIPRNFIIVLVRYQAFYN